MTFTKEFLQEREGETMYDRITGGSRWSVKYERVFKHEGKYYRTAYTVGATNSTQSFESQDESPYEYAPDEIECVEVAPMEETVYREVKT